MGPLAEAALERMSFDRVFLGADAVTAEDGICEADHAQTSLQELMARRGNSVYVLADSSKLGLRPFHARARLALSVDALDARDSTASFIALRSLVYVAGADRTAGLMSPLNVS